MLKQTFIFTLMLLIGTILCFTNSFGDGVVETVTDPSLILWLSFDELNGNRAIDHSQYGNHGTVVGNRQLVAGRFGNALTFNGVSDWVEIPHHESLTVDTSVTVMAWINTPRSHGPHGAEWQGIIAKNNDFRSYSFYTETGDLVHLSVGENLGAGSFRTDQTFALNTWQHVAAQVDSNGVQRYWINGESAGTFQSGVTLPGLADTASVLVGKTHEGNREFLGMIDEIRVWNRALSETEILEQMATGYGAGDPPVPPVTGVYMYWADAETNKIQRANLDGTNVQDLVPGFGRPVGIALDISGGKMYFTDRNAPDLRTPGAVNSIHRANLDGTNIETILPGSDPVKEAIALDISGGKMYWAEYDGVNEDHKIRRANLDGTNVEDLFTEFALGTDPIYEGPRGIALDISRRKMYWTNLAAGKIHRANLDGTNVEDLITGLTLPHHIALDFSGGKIYWSDYLDGKIQCANFNGTNVEDLVGGLRHPAGIALDVARGKMYWTDQGAGKIQRADLDGSNREDLVSGLGIPTGLALGIPQPPPGDGLRFSPDVIADQTFSVGTDVSLTLPVATGGTEPYDYTLTPDPPAGLQFDAIDRWIGGTPTTPMQTTPYTYTVTDANGTSAALTFTITVEDDGLNLDVNGDGKVDVLDLVWVAVSYGMRGDALPADVNADGVVNVQDLVAVAEGIDAAEVLPVEIAEEVLSAAEAAAAFEGVAGAPVMGFNTPRQVAASGITVYGNVAAALSDARALASNDVRLRKWMPLLEELLQVLAEMGAIPETTTLLPNYPNPFNPETWIPYHLAKAAHLTLTIYDMRGVAVRELLLGYQAAGVYESRGRAAYWDGRNDLGEPVASGVYFYTLTAGDFTATRKLLIRK